MGGNTFELVKILSDELSTGPPNSMIMDDDSNLTQIEEKDEVALGN